MSRVSIGHKDLNKSLFNIWENVFTIPNARDKRSYTLGQNLREEQQSMIFFFFFYIKYNYHYNFINEIKQII